MSTKQHFSRMTLDIPEEDHKRLKALAAILGKSMREIASNLIHEHLFSANLPDKETLQAIENMEKGKGLIEAKDADALFRKFGL